MPFWRRNSAGAELPATNGKHPGANLPEAGYDHPRRGTETDARRGAGGNYQKQRHQRQGRTAPAQNSGQNRSFAQAQTGSETGKQTGGRARTGGCGSETAAGTATGRPQNGSGTCLRNGFRSQTRTGSGAQERQHLPPAVQTLTGPQVLGTMDVSGFTPGNRHKRKRLSKEKVDVTRTPAGSPSRAATANPPHSPAADKARNPTNPVRERTRRPARTNSKLRSPSFGPKSATRRFRSR